MKASEWVVPVGLIIGGGGLSGLIGSLLAPLIRRPVVRAEATARITGAAAVLVDQLQEEVAAARKEAREMGQEAQATLRTVRTLSSEMDELTSRMHRLIDWIHDPTMTLDRLRVLVPGPPAPPPNSNGNGSPH
jgi:hypothetical protein